MARDIALTISLPAEDVERLDAALATERGTRRQPADTTREGFAALLLGRALLPPAPAPAMTLPIGPGLLSLAEYVHGEALRRGWLPESVGLEAFMQSAIYQIAKAVMDYRVLGMEPRDLRMLPEPKMATDYTGDQPEGWTVFIE